jgi:RNA recognition motif-containing protein
VNREGGGKTVRLRDSINAENRHRACKIRGLSWSTKPNEVVEFFQAFNITENDVVIEQEDGKNTGFALVFLKDEEEVERAKTDLDHQYIGKRWIGFCEIKLRGE